MKIKTQKQKRTIALILYRNSDNKIIVKRYFILNLNQNEFYYDSKKYEILPDTKIQFENLMFKMYYFNAENTNQFEFLKTDNKQNIDFKSILNLKSKIGA